MKMNRCFVCCRQLLVMALIALMSACTSAVRAPVEDAGQLNRESINSSSTGSSKNAPDGLQSQPLQPGESVQGEAISPRQSPPPVVVNLLRQSEQASAQQQWSKAETYLQRALRISPKNAVLWSRMAETKLQQGNKSQAIQFASKSNAITNDVILRQKNEAIMGEARR